MGPCKSPQTRPMAVVKVCNLCPTVIIPADRFDFLGGERRDHGSLERRASDLREVRAQVDSTGVGIEDRRNVENLLRVFENQRRCGLIHLRLADLEIGQPRAYEETHDGAEIPALAKHDPVIAAGSDNRFLAPGLSYRPARSPGLPVGTG